MVLLEICVDSIESALTAAKAGADRLELCCALSEGGLTPTTSLLKFVKQLVDIPVYCMIRPRGGIMVYSKVEQKVILEETKQLKAEGADGLVFGAARSDGEIDVPLCAEIAGPLPCTFHRLFDLLIGDPFHQLETIVQLGFRTILTSGCKKTAIDGTDTLKELVKRANGRIEIMAGAGVRPSNCAHIVRETGVTCVHASAKVKKKLDFVGKTEAKMGDHDDWEIYVSSYQQIQDIKREINNITESK